MAQAGGGASGGEGTGVGRELVGRAALDPASAFDPRKMDEAAMEELAESLASLRTTVEAAPYNV